MQDHSFISSDYISSPQLAKELGVNPKTLIRWRKARKSPPVTLIGQRVYYRRQAVKDWLLTQEGISRLDPRPHPVSIPQRRKARNARQRNARRAAK